MAKQQNLYSLPKAKVIADSLNAAGVRFTTFEIRIHKFVLQEITRHRMLSFSAASTRARPVDWVIRQVRDDPAMPLYWGKNQRGMQAKEELERREREECELRFLQAASDMINYVRELETLDLHKQTANRLLEPFMWADVVVSGTDWKNFFALRCHPNAQPELRVAAEAMHNVMNLSTPQHLKTGQWHLPYVSQAEQEKFHAVTCLKLSTARCARVSVKPYDESKPNPEKDYGLYEGLLGNGHWSPFEHPAQAMNDEIYRGNFCGWRQHRKEFEGESVFDEEQAKRHLELAAGEDKQ